MPGPNTLSEGCGALKREACSPGTSTKHQALNSRRLTPERDSHPSERQAVGTARQRLVTIGIFELRILKARPSCFTRIREPFHSIRATFATLASSPLNRGLTAFA